MSVPAAAAFPFAAGNVAAFSPFIGAQAGVNDLFIGPGAASYPAANATETKVTTTLRVVK